MKLFAVAGKPIMHSKSPQIHNAALNHVGIKGYYTRMAASSAKEVMALAKKLNIDGLNITAPFKDKIVEYLDALDPVAGIIGGVNTIVREGEIYKGYNTDYIGVRNSLKRTNVELKNSSCLVLGTGLAAKAAVYALKEEGAEVTICGRHKMKTATIASELVCKMGHFDKLSTLIGNHQIIVNTIPDNPEIFKDGDFNANHLLMDANYKNSALEAIAKQTGAQFVSGESWLLHQAIPAFKLFTGKDVDETVFFQALNEERASKKLLSLTCYLDDLKNKLNGVLAQKFDVQLIYFDKMIEEKYKSSIDDMIKEKGIGFLQRAEQEMLTTLDASRKAFLPLNVSLLKSETLRPVLREKVFNIFLMMSPDVMLDRLDGEGKSMLRNDSPDDLLMMYLGVFDEMLASADLIIDADHRNLPEIITNLYEEIHSSGIFG